MTVLDQTTSQEASPADLQRCVLLGSAPRPAPYVIERTDDHAAVEAYHALRQDVFVAEQRVFEGSDRDWRDDDPRTIVLVARAPDGSVLGGVRLGPAQPTADIGWWRGGRLVVSPGVRGAGGIGAALIRAACAHAEEAGVVRFDATIQPQNAPLFARLGWTTLGEVEVQGRPHLHVLAPVDPFGRLISRTKAPLGPLLDGLLDASPFLGDDAAPVPDSDLVAACDAIVPAMVERDPEWAGWCAVLVNVNDMYAMGAEPIGILDALGARDSAHAAQVIAGLRRAAHAWGIPVLGGHTQLNTHGALSVTALGRVARPVAASGASAGDRVRVTADLGGQWRPGYRGAQWDSSTHRSHTQLRSLGDVVPALDPTAAKDVSMAGLVGTLGMLAEASGAKAVLEVADVPRPAAASPADWLTCFPGFGVISTERAPAASVGAVPDFLTTSVCGRIEPGTGVELAWPDGVRTCGVSGSVTGLHPSEELT